MENSKKRGLTEFLNNKKKYTDAPIIHGIKYLLDFIDKDRASMKYVYDALASGDNSCYVFLAKKNLVINTTIDGKNYDYPLMDLLIGDSEKLCGQKNVATRLQELMLEFDDRIKVEVIETDTDCMIEYTWPESLE